MTVQTSNAAPCRIRIVEPPEDTDANESPPVPDGLAGMNWVTEDVR